MKRVGVIMALFLCALALISGFVNKVTEDSVNSSERQLDSYVFQEVDFNNWREVLQQIKAYHPRKSKAEIAAEKRRLAELAKRKNRTLEDATLVGTVLNSQSKALLILPGEKEPKEFSIGEAWLSPWTLFAVYSDYVVWQNEETSTKKRQALFK